MIDMTIKQRSQLRPAAGVPHRERGAALIVGLIMLLALTILGISGMNMAALELTMAGNMQAQHQAFERAETGIDMAITAPAIPGGMAPITSDEDGDGDTDIEAQTTFIGTSLVPDGAYSGDFQAYHFDTVSVGSGPRNASSTHNQSFYVIGPAPN